MNNYFANAMEVLKNLHGAPNHKNCAAPETGDGYTSVIESYSRDYNSVTTVNRETGEVMMTVYFGISTGKTEISQKLMWLKDKATSEFGDYETDIDENGNLFVRIRSTAALLRHYSDAVFRMEEKCLSVVNTFYELFEKLANGIELSEDEIKFINTADFMYILSRSDIERQIINGEADLSTLNNIDRYSCFIESDPDYDDND